MDIYEDLIKKEPNYINDKDSKRFLKKLQKSLGWVEPEVEYTTVCERNGKRWKGADIKRRIRWDVVTDKGVGFTCDRQEDSIIISLLVQINERLKRVEEEVNETK